jgi:hypothetical protein
MTSLSKTQSGELDKDSKPSYDHVNLQTSDAANEDAHYHGGTVSLNRNVNAILQNPLAGVPRVSARRLEPALLRPLTDISSRFSRTNS